MTIVVKPPDEKNRRRAELIEREISGDISLVERAELERLQGEMLAYRREIAPLPLDDLRALEAHLRELQDEA